MSKKLTPKLHKVEPVQVFEQAVAQIRSLIVEGELEPGEKLPSEQELGAVLDVGRSTVREAIRVLEAEGLVEVRRGAGSFVADRSMWTRNQVIRWLEQRDETITQLLQVRESIEGLTASLAATQASDEMLDELRSIVEEHASSVAEASKSTEPESILDVDKLANLDVRFHLLISAACGNAIAHEIVNHIVPAFWESNKAVLFASRSEKPCVEHRVILEALEARDSEAAEQAMRAHIARVWAELHELEKKTRHT